MKERIFKAVAMPPCIFGAPASLVMANVGVQLPMVLMLNADGGAFNPLPVVFSVFFVHILLVLLNIKEPHIANMLASEGKLPIFYKRIYKGNGRKKLAQ